MAVHLRLTRQGAKKAPFYRVVATDSRSPRDGRFIEHIGVYDPIREPVEIRFDEARLQHWLSVGDQPSETDGQLIKRMAFHGILAAAFFFALNFYLLKTDLASAVSWALGLGVFAAALAYQQAKRSGL